MTNLNITFTNLVEWLEQGLSWLHADGLPETLDKHQHQLLNMLFTARDENRITEVWILIDQLETLALRTSDTRQQGEIFINCAKIAAELENLKDALRLFQAAKTRYISFPHQHAVALWMSGCIHWVTGEKIKAIISWQDAIKLFRECQLNVRVSLGKSKWYVDRIVRMDKALGEAIKTSTLPRCNLSVTSEYRRGDVKNLHQLKYSDRFRYLLQKAIDLYAKTHRRNFSDVLAEMDDNLGYGHKSQTIQSWLNKSIVPNSAEVEYLAKKIKGGTDLDANWLKEFFEAAGYKVPVDLGSSQVSISNGEVEKDALGALMTIKISGVSRGQPSDIFISYARTDVSLVSRVYKTLIKKNYHPWMDVYSIKGGEKWLRAIYKAIDECDIFLAVLSNNSVSRRGVIQKELKKALDKWEGMLPDDIYILPLRIDDCPIPELLHDIQVIDWKEGKGRIKLLEAIELALQRKKLS